MPEKFEPKSSTAEAELKPLTFSTDGSHNYPLLTDIIVNRAEGLHYTLYAAALGKYGYPLEFVYDSVELRENPDYEKDPFERGSLEVYTESETHRKNLYIAIGLTKESLLGGFYQNIQFGRTREFYLMIKDPLLYQDLVGDYCRGTDINLTGEEFNRMFITAWETMLRREGKFKKPWPSISALVSEENTSEDNQDRIDYELAYITLTGQGYKPLNDREKRALLVAAFDQVLAENPDLLPVKNR